MSTTGRNAALMSDDDRDSRNEEYFAKLLRGELPKGRVRLTKDANGDDYAAAYGWIIRGFESMREQGLPITVSADGLMYPIEIEVMPEGPTLVVAVRE